MHQGEEIESGKKSIHYYLDILKRLPRMIIAVDDDTAIGACLELERRGIRVPEECALSGFDNTAMSNTFKNPLTTVHQPLFEQGKAAAQFLLDTINGKQTGGISFVKTKMLIRRSCGCFETVLREQEEKTALSNQQNIPDMSTDQLIEKLQVINQESHLFSSASYINSLVHQFQTAIKSRSPTSFLQALQSIYTDVSQENEYIFKFQEIITILRRFILTKTEYKEDREFFEKLFHNSRIVINQVAERRKSNMQYLSIEKYVFLGYMNSLLNTASKKETLGQVLTRIAESYFVTLEISSFFICLYGDPCSLTQSRLVFSYRGKDACCYSPDAGLWARIGVDPGFIELTVFKKILMDFHYRGILAYPRFLKIFNELFLV